jgi:hypothetical protein
MMASVTLRDKRFLTDANRDALFLAALVCLSTSILGFPFDLGIPDPVKSYLIWLAITSQRMAIRTIADRIAGQLTGDVHAWERYIKARMGMPLVRWLLFLPLFLITMVFVFLAAAAAAASGCRLAAAAGGCAAAAAASGCRLAAVFSAA